MWLPTIHYCSALYISGRILFSPRARGYSASRCLRVQPVLGHLLRYGVHNPLLLVQWYWVFGVYQHVAEGAQWTNDHLDVQPCEDPFHCLGETLPPVIHFLSVPSWTRVLANEAGEVTILLKCIYNLLLFLHSLYTWGWQYRALTGPEEWWCSCITPRRAHYGYRLPTGPHQSH